MDICAALTSLRASYILPSCDSVACIPPKLSSHPSAMPSNASHLQELIAAYRPGFSLDADFYTSEAVYQKDLQEIFFRHWIYVGQSGQLPEAGCYFLFNLGRESIIVVRDREQTVRAFANVCRHRGSRICTELSGKVAAFVCPYHAWTYGLDGRLRSKRAMAADFDPSGYGLKAIRCGVFHGMIFINPDENAAALADDLESVNASFEIYDLANTKVALRETYQVEANWKLAVENFMECYHCAPAHTEYARCHALQSPEDNAALRPAMRKQAARLGYRTATVGSVEPPTPLADNSANKRTNKSAMKGASQCYYARNALYAPFLTGSQDGKPLAPLLGNIGDYGGGVADIQTGAVSFGLLYADHAVLYGFAPRGVQATDMDVTWLVRADAEQGRDYDLDRLTWLWRVTTEADKEIIANNQKGINSRFYEPGPLSDMEEFTTGFIEWYLAQIR